MSIAAQSADLDYLHVADPAHFVDGSIFDIFKKLRRDDPVHYCADSALGAYWSVTRYEDIMTVDTSHNIYSSAAALGGIVIDDAIQNDPDNDFQLENFIAMDQPRHTPQRKAVQPIASPPAIDSFKDLVRERTARVLDSLPEGETFNWVEHVSIELTVQMLATLFDFPFEDRHKLVRWSDIATASEGSELIVDQKARIAELMECLEYFTKLHNQRVKEDPKFDLISMMAHDPNTSNLAPQAYLANILLLIVGGNDTTRNSMTASIYGGSKFPEQIERLRADRSLIPQMVSEVIRWQTPLAHMRRTALQDTELGGKLIKKGDKVVMWYLSGNYDTDMFTDPERIDLDRHNANRHMSFGFGIHRCLGLRIGELQLRILWEEMLDRFKSIEVMGPPSRVHSNFVHGYTQLPVKLTRF
ncbi:MAG: cytochrome P450 [Rhizobiales bacterium TMED143]|nr:cytochrome P450 [Rhodobiaceae bacterium]OUV89914.1 MAG: cytochrome P450 [Rhizobiales bacterium TMED143]CAI8403473.1 MAG: Linalool 8-monooxygenase [Rhodobiaceae bacterium UBA7378]|tara:strand:- start:113 stop:1354 length:1242 start_codon:yes stop_codon:yes gene_type:complete